MKAFFFSDFISVVFLLYSVLYLVLLPPSNPCRTCLGPDGHIFCVLALDKKGGSEILLAHFLKLAEDLQSTLYKLLGYVL